MMPIPFNPLTKTDAAINSITIPIELPIPLKKKSTLSNVSLIFFVLSNSQIIAITKEIIATISTETFKFDPSKELTPKITNIIKIGNNGKHA